MERTKTYFIEEIKRLEFDKRFKNLIFDKNNSDTSLISKGQDEFGYFQKVLGTLKKDENGEINI